jgi:hypothetical protein
LQFTLAGGDLLLEVRQRDGWHGGVTLHSRKNTTTKLL